MKKAARIFSVVPVILTLPLIVHADSHLHCEYAFFNAPFVSLDFDVLANGDVSKTVRVDHYGSAHDETFVRVAPTAADQQIHAWIAKESKDNQIEFMLYAPPKGQGNSEIINNQMPITKEIWGTCR